MRPKATIQDWLRGIAGTFVLLSVALGYGMGRWFGWAPYESLWLGALISVSSTVVACGQIVPRIGITPSPSNGLSV